LASIEAHLRVTGLGALTLLYNGPVDLAALAAQRSQEAQVLFAERQRIKEAGALINGILKQP